MHGPSTTARMVAAARLRSPRAASSSGRPGDDDRLALDVAGELIHRESPLQRHLSARTAFVDRVLLAALDDGVGQVVIAGAGYDGRAVRYARDDVRWFELDHPETQADKRARLERLGVDVSAVAFVAADFRDDPVAERLEQAGCRASECSLVICEGVAVYLEPEVLERLLSGLAAAVGPGSRLALTVSSSHPRALAFRHRFAAAVAGLGEPARSHLTATGVTPLLERAGWRQITDPAADPGSGFVLADRVRPR